MLVDMTKKRYQRITNVLSHRQKDLTILAEDVYKPHNLSAILRTCDSVGIGKAYAVNPTGGVPTFSASSSSADKWVDLEVYKTIEDATAAIKAQGMQIYAAHFSDDAVDYRSIDYTKPSCILLGNERSGVTDKAAQLADQRIIIPMFGMVPSLNVSVAAAIILFEAQGQRLKAGLYDRASLSEREINGLAYQWYRPKEAKRFAEQGLDYPKIDIEELE